MSDTLLGVPRDTLLRAMEICPVQMAWYKLASPTGFLGWRWQCKKLGAGFSHDRKALTANEAAAHIEHAFREWLVEYSCEVVSNLVCNLVWLLNENGKRIKIISSHGSNLTAQAMAVVASGVKPK